MFRSIQLTLMEQCVVFGHVVELAILNPKDLTVGELAKAGVLFIYISSALFGSIFFLMRYKKVKRLGE